MKYLIDFYEKLYILDVDEAILTGLTERDNIFDLLEFFKNVLEYQNSSKHVMGQIDQPFHNVL